MKKLTKKEEAKLDRAHLDAIPILIHFVQKMQQEGPTNVSRAAAKTLREWDKARRVK